jgi:hypothetical protein
VTAFQDSPWQIALSALLPILVCVALLWLEAKGPLSKAIRDSKGLVGPYFTSVSILFGLFAALLANDVWQKANAAKAAVQAEADSLHILAHLARAHGVDDVVLPKLRAYAKAASAEQPHSPDIDKQRDATGNAYLDLLTTLSQLHPPDAAVRNSNQTAARELLRAHDSRFYLASDITAPVKWSAILIFGCITQVALLLVHAGNTRASRIAVILFTMAFSFCLIVVAIFDAPFEILLHDEPARTMKQALDRL